MSTIDLMYTKVNVNKNKPAYKHKKEKVKPHTDESEVVATEDCKAYGKKNQNSERKATFSLKKSAQA